MTTSSPHPDQQTNHEDTSMPQQHDQDTGPLWSAAQAARRTGRGRATITRRLQAGQIPGATRDDQGNWQIPPAGLRAAGLDPDAGAATATGPADTAEVTRLRAELVAEQQRRAVAEAVAQERAEQVAHLRALLDRLTTGSTPQPRQRARAATRTDDQSQDTTRSNSTAHTAIQRTEIEQRIVGMRDAGHSFRQIADTLNGEGVPTLTGAGKWHNSSVGKVYRRLQQQ